MPRLRLTHYGCTLKLHHLAFTRRIKIFQFPVSNSQGYFWPIALYLASYYESSLSRQAQTHIRANCDDRLLAVTSSELLLKPITAEDLAAVVELDRQCLGGLWTIDGYQRELDSPNSELWAVARSRHQPQSLIAMGCFWAILEEAHITLLAVSPEYRRQGIGALLLSTLLQKAQARGLERATLEVRSSNQAAIALYQKFGFKIAGTRKKYYQDNQEDALILWLGHLVIGH